jgi:TusA-related sulfurtransferase
MDCNQIDARGKSCPMPLMLTKQALNDSTIPDKFELLIDCKTSRENVERFLKDNHILFETTQDEDCFRISIIKPE